MNAPPLIDNWPVRIFRATSNAFSSVPAHTPPAIVAKLNTEIVKALSDPTGVEEEVRHGGYHMIILDLMMPKLDGIAMLKRARELGKPDKVDAHTRFIIASNTKALTTLLLVVPLWAALLHQAFAMLVLAVAVKQRAGMAKATILER